MHRSRDAAYCGCLATKLLTLEARYPTARKTPDKQAVIAFTMARRFGNENVREVSQTLVMRGTDNVGNGLIATRHARSRNGWYYVRPAITVGGVVTADGSMGKPILR